MKSKKSNKHRHAAPKAIPAKESPEQVVQEKANTNEESTMVRVFYTTGDHRRPVVYWKMSRNKNGNVE